MRLSKTHRAYFEAARDASKLSDFPRTQIGAVAVYRHKIISTGFNTKRTEPIQKKYNICRFVEDTPHRCHAEIACLKPLIGRKDLNWKEVKLYVYREFRNGEIGMCRPCPSCEKFMRNLGIQRVFYTVNNGYTEERWYDE